MEGILNGAFITVAARDSLCTGADMVCSGKHDEVTLQQAIDRCAEEGKNLFLYNGTYSIDGFYDRGDGGPVCALCTPDHGRELHIVGQSSSYREFMAVTLLVSEEALNQVGEDGADVLRSVWKAKGLSSGSALHMENLRFILSDNQKPVRCVDLRRCDRPELKDVRVFGYLSKNAGFGNPPKPAVPGCIGITMTDGSNAYYSNYYNCSASGFHEGIQVGGEHVVMVNCATIMNVYGYTFGNYAIRCGANHPITMINCMDERNVHLPLFNSCGDSIVGGGRMQGGQEVTMISFNIERIAEQSPGKALGDLMREVHPGTWRGNIDFTAQPAWHHLNEEHFQLWENDGSGTGFKCRNVTHKTVCTTAERMGYYPTFGQQIFDTDLRKLLICTDPANKTWVDANGNIV